MLTNYDEDMKRARPGLGWILSSKCRGPLEREAAGASVLCLLHVFASGKINHRLCQHQTQEAQPIF